MILVDFDINMEGKSSGSAGPVPGKLFIQLTGVHSVECNRLASYFGIVGIVAAWVTIIVSALLNPWFSVATNALSDLGGGNMAINGHPSPMFPIIYDGGMIVTSFLIVSFSALMIQSSRNKLEITGESFFIISGLFLALIGIYHEGTYPHAFVSIWFFILSSISYATIGIALIETSEKKFGTLMLAIITISWTAYSLIPWGSVAEGEIFGIIVINMLVGTHIISLGHTNQK